MRKQIVLAMAVSGGLAGMVGINEVLGYRYRYYDGFSDNYGFTGIAVALLGRNHPVGVFLAALLFGVLHSAAASSWTPSPSTSRRTWWRCLQAVVILFVAAEAALPRPVRQVRPAQEIEDLKESVASSQ